MSAEQGMTDSPAQSAMDQAAEHGDFGGSQGYELDGDGQRVPPGMGQSKSSRRRRRKRKGKGEGAEAGAIPTSAPAAGGAMPGEVIGGMQAGAAPAAEAPAGAGFRQNGAAQGRSFNAGQNGVQNGAGAATPGGTKRWKKKSFRDRERPRTVENPGNQQSEGGFSQGGGAGFTQNSGSFGQNGGGFRGPDTHQPGNGGGFKRKGGFGGKQRNGSGGGGGSRGGFVGPMDHSYRAPNGNIFESSPSTIDPHMGSGGGRGRSYQSDSQPIDYSQGRVIPIKEGTQTKIYFFIEDLFFTAKIQETARKLGVKVEFLKNEKEKIAELTSADEENRPGLIVFDLNNANAKPLTLIPKLKTKLKKSTSIIGFLSHLQGDLKAKAVEAGCDTVMPRAAFSQNLPNLLRRYGIEEVEEPNYNQ